MSALSKALDQLRKGGMIVLVDDEDRENEGDLVMAAEFATPEAVNFMIRHGRGLVCLTLTGTQTDKLGLTAMVAANKAQRSTAFTVSIEAREGVTTGISPQDRARTIAAAIGADARLGDVVSPGHVFPLRAEDGGVIQRNGHTEGSVDLARMAGLNPAGVICEIIGDDGEMMRRPQLEKFAKQHDLPILTIEELVAHRVRTEQLVEQVAIADLPNSHSDKALKVVAFTSQIDGQEHVALVKYPLGDNPVVRVHSECLTGDAFGSLRCDCGPQLHEAMRLVGESSGGAVIYVRGQEGRGIGLANKMRAYALQDAGKDTIEANMHLGFPADGRDYGVAAQIIKALGVSKVQLLSNNPDKAEGLRRYGVEVSKMLPLVIAPNKFNADYLATKGAKFGHLLDVS